MTPLLIVVAVVGMFIILLYNTIIRKRNMIENAFGSIDAMLKKRYDLIPNLVDAVQEYMEHESTLLKEITEMRAKAMSGRMSHDETIEVNNQIGRSIRGMMLSVEDYPDLKASDNFLQLQGALNEVEEQLSASRRTYNAAVTDFNNAIEIFPANIVAGLMRFTRREVLETPEEERAKPDVGDLFDQ